MNCVLIETNNPISTKQRYLQGGKLVSCSVLPAFSEIETPVTPVTQRGCFAMGSLRFKMLAECVSL